MPTPAWTDYRDRCWLWCHHVGAHNGAYNLPVDSRISPADAARSLGIAKQIFVCLGDEPRPPFGAYAEPMRGADELVWSIVGDSSSTRNDSETDLEPVLALARSFPNLTGAIMDDFFIPPGPTNPAGKLARWEVDAVAAFRQRLRSAGLDLWVVAYDLLLDLPIEPWLAECDVITYWTWQARNLPQLEVCFARLEAMAPTQRKLLGLYMWDYGSDAPMPMAAMQWQCDKALEWLAAGRIDGAIFLASNLADLDIDTVHYVRGLMAAP